MVLVVWFLPNYLSFARTPRSESDSLLVGVVLCLHSLFLSLSLSVCVCVCVCVCGALNF